MFKQKLSLTLIAALLFSLTLAPDAAAKTKAEKDVELSAKVKAGIAKLGVGPDTRVEVKLRDKTKLKGYVSAVNEVSFAVTDLKTGAATTVAYPDVAQVKGNNLTTGGWIAIAALGVAVTLLLVFLAHNKS